MATSSVGASQSVAQRLSDTTSVPIRGEYVPPSAAPVSLTTELFPSEAGAPLLPDGAEAMTPEVGAIIATNRRWTFSMEARSIYDDNIFLGTEGTEQGDVVFLLTPSVTYRRGDTAGRRESYLAASYSPSASFFVDHSGENSLDHSVRLDAQKRFGNFTVGVDGRYQRLSGATVELSDRVDRDEAGARVRSRYEFSGRTSLEVSAAWNAVDYRDTELIDSDEWVAESFVGYQATGRTRLAVGGAIGVMDVDGGSSQDFTRGLLRVTTEATGKLTLEAKGGVEFRNTGAGSQTTPVFNVTAEYRPTARTAIGAGLYSDVTASGSLSNENVIRTGAAMRVQQKLGSRLTAAIEAGYEQLSYESSEAGVPDSGREDEYFFVRPSLRYEFTEGRRAEIYYSLRKDDSSDNEFDFEANQTGLALAFDF